MGFTERKELYTQIENIRKRPLIAYFTSSRVNASGQMGSDIIPEFAKQINEIPRTQNNVDVLIVSNGGDPTVSWRIISMLRERFENIGVLLPYAAFSAATLFALGANEILMHPFSNLGPVDPQLTYKKNQNEEIHFGSEDLRNFFDFIQTDIGITDQEQKERAFELLCKETGAIGIGVAKRSTNFALSMGEKLLNLHLEDSNKAKTIAESLNTSFYHHGYPVGRNEAKKIGLPVVYPENELETLLWKVWEDIEDEMDCNKPFNPLEVVLSDKAVSPLLDTVSQAIIPANLPPQFAQQAMQSILSKINIITVPKIEYELFQATIESIRCKSDCRTKLLINAIRLPDMNINITTNFVSMGWQSVEIES